MRSYFYRSKRVAHLCLLQLQHLYTHIPELRDKRSNKAAVSAQYFITSVPEGSQCTFFFSFYSIHKRQLLVITSLWITKILVSSRALQDEAFNSVEVACLRNNRYFRISQLKIVSTSSSSLPQKVEILLCSTMNPGVSSCL